MNCYACDQEATQHCARCGNPYCPAHGDPPPQALCADCLDPINAAPSGTVFRLSVFALLAASVLALWLLIRPPSLPGESSEVSQPKPSPLATPVLPSPGASPTAGPGASPTRGPTPAPTETAAPEPEGPIEYTVVEGDTWFGIAGAFGVDAADLAAVNGRTLDDFIQPGEVLVIPQ